MKEHLAKAEIHLSFMLPHNTLCCGQAKVFENYVFTVGFQKKRTLSIFENSTRPALGVKLFSIS